MAKGVRWSGAYFAETRARQLKAAEAQARKGKANAYVHMIRNGSNHVAHYRGELQGKGNITTRLGEKSTGIRAAVYGWNSRVEVKLEWDERMQRDNVRLYADGVLILWMPFEEFAKGEQAIIEHIAHKALEKQSHG